MTTDAAAKQGRLWTQREAAEFLSVSARYLRDSGCPKVLLPSQGHRPIVRYNPDDVRAWSEGYRAASLVGRPPATPRPARQPLQEPV